MQAIVAGAGASSGTRSLRAIALFEAAKGGLALLVAVALAVVGPDALRHALGRVLSLFSHTATADTTSSLLDRITPGTLEIAVAVILAYAAMRLIEGWGLWRHRIWASWLGCIGAALYLPFELYALWQHPDWLTGGVLLLNLLIVLVLSRDILRQRRPA